MRAPVKLLLLSLNYAPEPVGIGPYSTELAEGCAACGDSVHVVSAKPYYPAWRIDTRFRGGGYSRAREAGIEITRCPLYVPSRPSGLRRILHHLSFAAAALLPMMRATRRERPDVVMAIAPGLLAAPVALLAARLTGARSWLHVQDFEVEAAIATGLIRPNGVAAKLAGAFERAVLSRFDMCSSISPAMCAKLAAKGIPAGHIMEFRNWADIDAVRPNGQPSPYRAEFGIVQPHIALYSGNIANKQGLEVIVEAARRLQHRTDILFLICGEGSYLATLRALAGELPNIRIEPLQPRERLGELMRLATLHLLPQLSGAADLVLPSKLTNMLASGRPVVATADPGTGLADEVQGCGLLTPPGDGAALGVAITSLVDDPERRTALGRAARRRAEERWARPAILARFHDRLVQLSTMNQRHANSASTAI